MHMYINAYIYLHTRKTTCAETHMNASCHTHKWAMPNACMRHGTHMNESQDTWMSHVHTCMSHVIHMNESRYTQEWVMSHACMSRVPHTNKSYHTHERVKSLNIHVKTCILRHSRKCVYVKKSRVAHMSESCHASGWGISPNTASHWAFTPVFARAIHVTNSYICVTNSYTYCMIYGIGTSVSTCHTCHELIHICSRVTHLNEACP